jgi:hypothetical protein
MTRRVSPSYRALETWLGLAMADLISAVISAAATWPWSMISALFGGAAFFAVIYTQIVRPRIRHYRLKHPCKVYFAIPPLGDTKLEHVLQDDVGHEVAELVLPPNKIVEVELIICPRIGFHDWAISFGCDGSDEDKPIVIERVDRLIKIGKSRWIPGEDDGYAIDRHGYIQIVTNKGRTKGSRIPIGFRLQTKNLGTYLAHIFFFTEERVGEAALTIRVEEKPKTPMRCRVHWGCYVTPVGGVQS